MSFLKISYYDKPDGEDVVGKLLATNTYAVIAGLSKAAFDVLLLPQAKGYLPIIRCVGNIVGPFMGMATAFTLTTYTATNMRKKDDLLNYFLGGLASGSVYGAWKKCHLRGINVGLAFGIAGAIKKLSIIEGWEFFPENKSRIFMMASETDYTLTSERPRNWTTEK